ncbi:Threonine/homoserine efflux transporter RhtA [Roseovarius pacificus]|uniref:Threonine/homoserine efflux transporter RhtA n=1 Tax=Roseovarius pacificus TaxID=337701 RepID=A0A1M7IRY1_9RHOB|nr:DMT family transporter [Roseovarius pacificus]GGO61407.1 permease [Roseovarius pacificus]SHM43368.1 Threonine/homoserine efflux transporter RhtA [Roseovarius pacificus]
MHNTIPRKVNSATIGLALMASASLIVPIVDGIAKLLGETLSPLLVAWARYAAATLVVLPIALAARGRRVFPRQGITMQFLRTLCLVFAMTLFFVSLQWTTLAAAIAAYFSGPIVAMLLSVLFLNERLTIAKGTSLVLAVFGALIVLQPFGGGSLGAGIALLAGCFHGVYLVVTKLSASRSDSLQTLCFQCLVGTLLLSPQAALTFEVPSVDLLWLILSMGAISALAHFLTIQAFRYAEASSLSPLVYLELVGAIAFGAAVFGDLPGPATLIGGTLIALSGLMLHRSETARD